MKYFSKIILLGCLAFQLHAQTWNTSPEIITGTSMNDNLPVCAPAPWPNNFIATYSSGSDNTNVPTYSLYNATTALWS